MISGFKGVSHKAIFWQLQKPALLMWNVKCMKFLLCLPKHTTYRHFRRRRSVVYVSVSFSNSLPGTRVCPLPLHCAESEMKWESYLFLSMSMFSFQNHRMVRELHKVLWIFSPVNVSVSRRNLFSVESVLLYGWCTWVGLVLRPGVHLTICHTHTRMALALLQFTSLLSLPRATMYLQDKSDPSHCYWAKQFLALDTVWNLAW